MCYRIGYIVIFNRLEGIPNVALLAMAPMVRARNESLIMWNVDNALSVIAIRWNYINVYVWQKWVRNVCLYGARTIPKCVITLIKCTYVTYEMSF